VIVAAAMNAAVLVVAAVAMTVTAAGIVAMTAPGPVGLPVAVGAGDPKTTPGSSGPLPANGRTTSV
jgi:hypothetical protein